MARRNPRQPRGPENPQGPIAYGALQHAIGYLIHLAELASMQEFSRAFAGTGVTPARFTALELIACNPGIRPSTLASAMAVERSNLVAIIRFLMAHGWIAAGAGSNRREKALALTAAGEAALTGLRLRLRAHDAALATGCSPQERQRLARLLARIVGARRG